MSVGGSILTYQSGSTSAGNVTITNITGNILIGGMVNADAATGDSNDGILSLQAGGNITLDDLDLTKVRSAALKAGGNVYIRRALAGFDTTSPSTSRLTANSGSTVYYNPLVADNLYLAGATYSLGAGNGTLAPLLPTLAGTTASWVSTSDTDFETGANWDVGNAPTNDVSSQTATFPSKGALVDPVLTASRSVAGVNFADTDWTLSASPATNVLTVGLDGVDSAGSGVNVLKSNIRLDNGGSIWTIGSGSELIVSNLISGTGYLTKDGAGTLTLATNSALTNVVGVINGTLNLQSSNALASAMLVVTGGMAAFQIPAATLAALGLETPYFANSGQIALGKADPSGTACILTAGDSRNTTCYADLVGAGSYVGSLVKVGAGRLTLSGSTTLNNLTLSAGSLVLAGPATLTSLSPLTTGTLEWRGNGGTLAGGVIVTGGTFVVSGANNTLSSGLTLNSGTATFAGSSTLGGNVTVNGGTLQFTNSPTLTGGTIIINGGTVQSSSTVAQTNAAATVFAGPVTFGGTGALTFTNQVVLAGIPALTVSPTVTLAGNVVSGGLFKAGSGMLVLAATNDFAGPVTLFGGTLQMTASGTLGSNAPVTIYDGTLALSNAANVAANQAITISNTPTTLGVLSLRYDGLPGGITADSTGVLAIDTTNFNATVDMSRIGSTYLGSVLGGTNRATVLSVANDATYRLGGGSSTLVLDAAGTTAGVLTGTCAVVVGKAGPGGNYAGNIVLADANTYSGTTTVNRGSALTGYAQPASGGSPFGNAAGDVVLNAGTLALSNGGAVTTRDPVSKGVLTYAGSSALQLTGLHPATNVQLTLAGLVRGSTYPAVLKIGGVNKLGSNEVVQVTGGVPATYGIVAPYMVHDIGGAADFLTYDASGFRVATNYTVYTTAGPHTPAANEISSFNGGTPTVNTASPYAVRCGDISATIAAGATLTIGSGGLLWYANGARSLSAGNTSSTVNFGAQEGVIHVAGGSTLAFYPKIAGSAGFIKSGRGTLVVRDTAKCTGLTGRISVLEGYLNHVNSGNWTFTNVFPEVSELVLDGGGLDSNNQPATYPAKLTTTIGPNGGAIYISSSGGSQFTINGPVQGPGMLWLRGPEGTVTFNGTNTYAGGTYIQTRVTVAAGSSLGTGPVHVYIPSATYNNVDLNGASNISATARLSMATPSLVRMPATATPYQIGSLLGSGTLQLGPSASSAITTLLVGGDNTATPFGGVIIDRTATGRGSLIKVGNGTLTLAGANTYTGPTIVSNGTLLVNGRLAAGSAVTVAADGTLGGIGTVSGVVTNYGTLSPGASVGTLTTSNLVLMANSTSRFEVGGAANDKVVVNGSLTLAGTFEIEALPGLVPGTYTLITYTGTKSGDATLQMPAGMGGKLDTSTPGLVNLVVSSAGTLIMIR